MVCLTRAILANLSFALEENVSSAVGVWSFYKCHQVKFFVLFKSFRNLVIFLKIVQLQQLWTISSFSSTSDSELSTDRRVLWERR